MPGEGFIFVVLLIVDIITHHLAQEGSSKKTNYLYKICHKSTCAKYFIAAFSKIVNLIVIDRNENHPVFGKHISCKYQLRIYHRAPIRMKTRIAVVVLNEILILVLVKEAGLLVIVLLVHFKVVVIDEVVLYGGSI